MSQANDGPIESNQSTTENPHSAEFSGDHCSMKPYDNRLPHDKHQRCPTVNHQLIGIDRMEPSQLRRELDPWDNHKASRVLPLITRILQTYNSTCEIRDPRWELSVYPLYYHFWRDESSPQGGQIFRWIREEFSRMFPEINRCFSDEEICRRVNSVADAEIDLLIEDLDYFIFVEVKVGQSPKFGTSEGVHQLVRQYLEGIMLERLISKKFMLATVGAISALPTKLSDTDKLLLSVIGKHDALEIPAFDWRVLREPASVLSQPNGSETFLKLD